MQFYSDPFCQGRAKLADTVKNRTFFGDRLLNVRRSEHSPKSITINQCLHCKFALFMYKAPDILALAYKQPPMDDRMVLLQEKHQQIPGSVHYTINRYY